LKSVLDKGFKYVPSIETDLAKTFARVKKEQERAKKEADDLRKQLAEKLTTLRFNK
jgi:hypothetical protein